MLYLQPMAADAGALRLIPGSQRWPYHTKMMEMVRLHATTHGCTLDPVWQARTFGVPGHRVPAHACEVEPGDLVVFHQSLFHAVFGHLQGRSYVATKFAARPRTDFELASLSHSSHYAFEPDPALAESPDPILRQLVAGMAALGPRAKELTDRLPLVRNALTEEKRAADAAWAASNARL